MAYTIEGRELSDQLLFLNFQREKEINKLRIPLKKAR